MKELGIKNIITGIFIIAAILAFFIFSGVIKIGTVDQSEVGNIVIWGDLSQQTLQPYIDNIKTQKLNIVYSQKNTDVYEDELVNAFAAGRGPDLFIMPYERILRHSDKILELPYASFPKNNYESTYVKQSHLFLTDTGVIAFPMTVDPLIMYYNKSLVASAFLLDVPEYWEDLSDFTKNLTVKNNAGEIAISGVALGTYDNVRHAKDILSTLILQSGNQIVGTDSISKKKKSIITADENAARQTEQAVAFYASFAQLDSPTYSWNEAVIDSQNKFIAGEVVLYFGRSSEIESIRRKNPNLDFGVSIIPQVRGNTTKLTHGDMLGIAIGRQTGNVPAAVLTASKMAGLDVVEGLSSDLMVAPARRDLLRNKPEDPFKTLVYNSAIISDGWIDSDSVATEEIFRTMIRSINTNALSIIDALRRANADINRVLNRTINMTIPDKF
jgi:ABC-type glycerol-3-phosphate transport system substrate-binding protein